MSVRLKIFEQMQTLIDEELDYTTFCRAIYFHPGGESLRLNHQGIKLLSDFLSCHVVDVVDKTKNRKTMPSKHYVFLSRYSKMPYYIGEHNITFFDEEAAFLFKLCDGDIENVKNVTD